jgi:hypothetical protein
MWLEYVVAVVVTAAAARAQVLPERLDPEALPGAVTVGVSNLVRVTVLRDGLLRLQARPSSSSSHAVPDRWDDRPTLQVLNRNLGSVPAFNVTPSSTELTVVTRGTTLRAGPSNATVQCSAGGDGAQPSYSWSWGGGGSSSSRSNSPAVDFPSLVSAAGMYILDDTNTSRLAPGSTQAGHQLPGEAVPWLDRGDGDYEDSVDFYIFCYGQDFSLALSSLVDITGAAPLMPRSAYGVWWCQCCPAYTDESFNTEVLLEYAQRQLPLSQVVLDMDWHAPGWNRYLWDADLFPDPQDFVAQLHNGTSAYPRPLKLALNIHPGAYNLTRDMEPIAYDDFAKAMGEDPAANKGFVCNLWDSTYAAALVDAVLRPLGVDYLWDDCFSCTWQAYGTSGSDGGSCGDNSTPGVDGNVWAQHVFNGLMARGNGKRPLTLNRLPGVAPSNVRITPLVNPQLTSAAGLAGHRCVCAGGFLLVGICAGMHSCFGTSWLRCVSCAAFSAAAAALPALPWCVLTCTVRF